MKTYVSSAALRYAVLGLMTAAVVAALSLGPTTFAQTANVSCSANTTAAVSVNQPVTFTATGGDGSYIWTGPNLDITNATGKQFVVTYPSAGTYPITVTSDGKTATCTMTVVGGGVYTPPVTPGLPNTGGGYNK